MTGAERHIKDRPRTARARIATAVLAAFLLAPSGATPAQAAEMDCDALIG
ncbi:MAG: hypothetical protein IH994_13205, partial [Proteobacteria bacterium]|nr:hypothetical protein [Pseudomonadota bacterium]